MAPDFWTEPAHNDRLRYACCGLLVLAAFGLGGMRLASEPDGPVASDTDTAILVDLPPELASSAPKAEPTEAGIARNQPTPEKALDPEPDPIPKAPAPPEPKPDAVLPPDEPKPVQLKPVEARPREPPALVQQALPAEERPQGLQTPSPEAPPIESEATRAARAKAISRWQNALVTKLEAAKHKAASATRETGTVVLAFAIDRQGHLRREALSKSSGSRVLDGLALGLLEAAAPFPSPPGAMGEAMLAFSIPIRFNPRR